MTETNKTMKSLTDLQTAFSDIVFDGVDCGLGEAIVRNGLDWQRRLQVYRNNIFSSLTQALQDVYPVVERLVGEEFFKFSAHSYISAHPSRTGDLHEFGDQFSHFLSTFEPASNLVYMADVAALEWAYHEVFHAADALPVDIGKLQGVAQEDYSRLHFTPHPASRLIHSPYPVLKIWQANQSLKDDNITISLDEGGVRLSLLRREMDIEFHILSDGEFAFLEACHRGATYIEACEAANSADPGINISESLLWLIQNNLIVDFRI